MASTMRYINMVSRCCSMYRSQRLEGTELGACHIPYILTLCRNPGITQDTLCKMVYINKSNVTRALSYLEQHGYVERIQSEADKRVLLVYPTEKAEEALPAIRSILKDWNEYITEDISESEMNAFMTVLEKIAKKAASYGELSETAGEGERL